MIKIVARSLIKEGEVEHYKELAKEMVEKSAAEEGNIYYTLNADRKNPRVLAYIECWKDGEAVKKHNASEHFQRIVPLTRALVEESSVDIYTEVEF